MGDIVSHKSINIDYSGGNFQLKRVKSGSVSYDSTTEVVVALGVSGGAGFRDKEGGGKINLEVYRETGNPEVDYRKLFVTKEVFAMTFQDLNGAREQCRSCRVGKIPDGKFDENGDIMDTVEIVFLQSSRL